MILLVLIICSCATHTKIQREFINYYLPRASKPFILFCNTACRAVCHPDCKGRLPLPCVPSNNTPGSGKKGRVSIIHFWLTS